MRQIRFLRFLSLALVMLLAASQGLSPFTRDVIDASVAEEVTLLSSMSSDLISDESGISAPVTRRLDEIIQVSASHYFSCALTAAAGVKCWGSNLNRQLGDGTTEVRLTPADVVGLENGVTAIATGGDHVCALTDAGGVKCWGGNWEGQLGNGTTEDRVMPVDVIGLGSGVTAISAGNLHTCALTSEGGVKCWGRNWDGQLGDGTTEDRSAPVDVSGLTSGVIAISAAGFYTCALTTNGGVMCWGENENGQLGNGTTTDRLTPMYVSGLTSNVSAISAGGLHSCALLSEGNVRCWGYNESGQLGDGTTIRRDTPVDVSGLTGRVVAISVDGFYSCALTIYGGAKCWGDNRNGQLGDGTTENRLAPTYVSGLDSDVVAISAGALHACVLTTDSTVKCWGDNFFGELGDGTTEVRLTPVDVIWDRLPGPMYMPLVAAPQDDSGTPTPILAEETMILSSEASQTLSGISDDGNTYIFAHSIEVAALEPGAVMVGQPSAVAPSGFLRRVMEVSEDENEVRVETEFATLQDAILQGEISFSKKLTAQNVVAADLPNGVTLVVPADPAQADRLVFSFQDAVFIDGDNNLLTENDQVRVSGQIEMDANFDFQWVGWHGSAPEFVATLTGPVKTELQVTWNYQKELFDKLLFEVPVGRFAVFVGAMPVWIDLLFTVRGSGTAKFSTGLAGGLFLNDLVTGRLTVTDSNPQVTVDIENKESLPSPLVPVILRFSGKAGLYGAIETRIYSVAGPYISFGPYLELLIDPVATPWGGLYRGFDVEAGLRSDVLGYTLGRFGKTVTGYRHLVKPFTEVPPSPTRTPMSSTPTPTQTSIPPTVTPTETPVSPSGPTLQVDPPTGVSGTRFYIYGRNFVPGESVNVWTINPNGMRSDDPDPQQVGSDGKFTDWVQHSGAHPTGTWTVYARGTVSGQTVSATFVMN